MSSIKLLSYFIVIILIVVSAHADLISEEETARIINHVKTDISSYDDLVEIYAMVEELEQDKLRLGKELDELKAVLNSKLKQEQISQELDNQVKNLRNKSQKLVFTNSNNIDSNYDKALVALEALSLDIAKKYLLLVIKDKTDVAISTEIDNILKSKANLLLGYIMRMQDNIPSALSHFTLAYNLSSSANISLLSLEAIMDLFSFLDKKKELCTTYTNYQNNLQSIIDNNVAYDKTLINNKFIQQVALLCKVR